MILSLMTLMLACEQTPDLQGTTPQAPSAEQLARRAYVVSEESDGLFVFDTQTFEFIGTVNTNVHPGRLNANHMSLVSPDGTQIFVAASHAGSVVVVDAVSLEVSDIIPVGAHNSHGSFTADGGQMWMVIEDEGAVVVMDTLSHEILEVVQHESMVVPHNVRFSRDGALAYVPSIGGNQISVVDTQTYQVVDVIVPEGLEPGACSSDPCGFADAQIDADGVLFAAHIESGEMLVYDTVAKAALEQISVGSQPWAAFVDVGDVSPTSWMVPNFGDATVAVVNREDLSVNTVPHGDSESYGVNYSALTPGSAYVLNKHQERVAILDANTGELEQYVNVGGTTETATTTPDGKYILLPLSSAGALAVFDVEAREVVKRFEGVGVYPWSVAMSSGQNYCH